MSPAAIGFCRRDVDFQPSPFSPVTIQCRTAPLFCLTGSIWDTTPLRVLTSLPALLTFPSHFSTLRLGSVRLTTNSSQRALYFHFPPLPTPVNTPATTLSLVTILAGPWIRSKQNWLSSVCSQNYYDPLPYTQPCRLTLISRRAYSLMRCAPALLLSGFISPLNVNL